jgi:type I restriction enzyme M protein
MGNDKSNANLGFEKQIWDAACVLWGHIPAAEYRKVIIGLIFLRYISCVFEKKYKQLVEEGDGFEDDRDAYTEDNVFFVPKEARWSVIATAAHTPEIGTVIDNAMRAIENENSVLKNVLPKNYGNPDLDKKVLGDVVDLFTNEIHMDDTEESKDLLGRTYEYCIAQFAEVEGTSGGEYYTPSSIVKILVEVLKPFEDCRVYDPCCGSGGMFVQSEKFLEAHGGRRGHISVYGQEANSDTWKMAKINMAIRGIDADFGPYHADTFSNDLHPNLKADFILANPPFNYHPWGQENLTNDPRWRFGLPPASNANFAWIQHMIYHLAPNGKIGLVLANGALSSQNNSETEIRKGIIDADLVEGIVALPGQMFYSVPLPVTLWFFNKNKKNKGKILFIDARNMGKVVDRKHRDFSKEEIEKIVSTFEQFQDGSLIEENGFCSIRTIMDVADNNYVLTAGRYVGFADEDMDDIPFDEKINKINAELLDLMNRSDELKRKIITDFDKLNLK